jgi:hypothetical protein
VVVALAIVGVLGYIGYQQVRQFQTPVPPAVVAEPEPVAPPPTREPPAPPAAAEPVPTGLEVTVQARGLSWLRVVADDREVFAGFVRADDRRSWAARHSLTVRVGNAPAVTVLVNGQPVPLPPGRRVWQQTFTAEGR